MNTQKPFSENDRINSLIETIISKLCPFLEEQANEISELTAIGKALGTGKDINVLLEMILSIARRFTKADGGTLYLVDLKTRQLSFNVIQNDTLGIKKNDTSINLPGVSLYNEDNSPNFSNVSSYVFHTGKIVNIHDVYTTEKFKFNGTKRFDKALSYRSRSMIVIPMRNHENEIIGILQLINSKDPTSNNTINFSKDDQEKAAALASQASVILTQHILIHEMKELFETFIKIVAASIDEKSKHTGGHIQRVTELCMLIAKKINQDEMTFKDTFLSYEQVDELRIAALMHDTGKITIPDHIIKKSSRLETVYDRIELIKTRWDLFKTNQKLAAANKKLALFDQRSKQQTIRKINTDCKYRIAILDKELETLSTINSAKDHLNQSLVDDLEEINKKSCHISGKTVPYLLKNEFLNLSILRGTLTPKERKIIKSHVDLTQKMLNQLPWPKKLANIPLIAGAHHERLDGSGYPRHINKTKLNVQSRILAIADVFEALSATDRPYKKTLGLSKIIRILKQMSKNELIDKEIVDIFFESGAHLEYAQKHFSASQIDL